MENFYTKNENYQTKKFLKNFHPKRNVRKYSRRFKKFWLPKLFFSNDELHIILKYRNLEIGEIFSSIIDEISF